MKEAYLFIAVLCLVLCVAQCLLVAYFIRRGPWKHAIWIIASIMGLLVNAHTLWQVWPRLF